MKTRLSVPGWFLVALVLVCMGAGCGGSSDQGDGDAQTIKLGERYVGYSLPGGFQGRPNPSSHEWRGEGEGRLVVHDAGPDNFKLYADQLTEALKPLDSDPQKTASAILRMRVPSFDSESDRAKIAEQRKQIEAGCQAVYRKDVAGGKARLQAALAALRALELGDDIESHVRHYLDSLNRKGEGFTLLSLARVEVPGHPAARTVCSVASGGHCTGLFVLVSGELLAFEFYDRRQGPDAGTPLVERIASTLEFDVEGSPAPTGAGRDSQDTRGRGDPKSPWMRRAARFLPLCLLLLFTSVPAFVGASLGYETGRLAGNPVKSAASSAFWVTVFGVTAGCLIVVVVVLTLLSQAKSGSGIMSPMMGGIFMTMLIALLGGVAALLSGAMAAFGAWLGAHVGRTAAAFGAALAAAPGALVAVNLLGLGPR